jgi:hypothetical protein
MARRTRCIICNELTHSGWNLGYPDPKDPKKWVQGIHCFKHSREVRGALPKEEVKVSIE